MKGLWIYTVVSILTFGIVIFPRSEVEYYNYLENQLICFNEIIDNLSNSQLGKVQNMVEAYPEYGEYLQKAEQVDSVRKAAFQSERIDLLTINNNFFCSLLEEKNRYDTEEEIKLLQYSLIDFDLPFIENIEDLPLSKPLNHYALKVNRLSLFNYFEMKTGGTICYFDSSFEPVGNVSQSVAKINESYTFDLMSSTNYQRRELKVHTIFINNEKQIVHDGKARFKAKATKSGWNEMKILVDATFLSKVVQKEKTFRYYIK